MVTLKLKKKHDCLQAKTVEMRNCLTLVPRVLITLLDFKMFFHRLLVKFSM